MEQEFLDLSIVQYLQKNSESLYSNIIKVYHFCESILSLIPKDFTNYTLHDIKHSVRVIGYMNELVKDHLNRYSNLHIALMIYAGLLHDIGMFVSDDERKALYDEFSHLFPDFCNYSEAQKTEYLQEHIRKNHGRRVESVLEYKINENASLRSLFCIGKSLSYDISPTVVAICRAHTESTDWVKDNDELDIYRYGKDTINPRHIAILLRIGDYLDIDDQRAPYLLYNMIKPQGYSESEWQKHFTITNYKKIDTSQDKYKIVFYGKCSDPEIYRKMEEYIGGFQGQLENELQLCEDEYRINIELPIVCKIQTIGFACTPLRFSLDYKQISKLLMGNYLYGDRKAGLRELLQNSIDAVLHMKEIKRDDPYFNYVPIIGIDFRKKQNQIVVFDNGTGMSENILQNYFFNVGNSYYRSEEYNETVHIYNPIGHFGIGFLACFMLSSRVILETKHYSNGSEFIRMSFTKNSPYIIKHTVEKNEQNNAYCGTRILLDYDQVIPNVFSDETSIINYIRHLLVYNYNYSVRIFYNGELKETICGRIPKYVYTNRKDIIEFDAQKKHYPVAYKARDFFKQWYHEDEDRWPRPTFIWHEYGLLSIDSLYITILELRRILKCTHNEEEVRSAIQSVLSDKNEVISKVILSYESRIRSIYEVYGDLTELYDIILTESFLDYESFLCYLIKIEKDTTSDELNKVYHDMSQLYGTDPEDNAVDILDREPNSHLTFSSPIMVFVPKARYLGRYIEDDIIHEFEHKYHLWISGFHPKEHHYDIIKNKEKEWFVAICKDEKGIFPLTYIKGVYVTGDNSTHITFPYQFVNLFNDKIVYRERDFFDFEFEYKDVFFNFLTGQYDLNVSRNDLVVEEKEKVKEEILCLLYMYILYEGDCSNIEKEFIEMFLSRYYHETYMRLKRGRIERYIKRENVN